MVDPLEAAGPLTEWDYRFLKGDDDFWFPGAGAAYNVVSEYCKNHGYGHYGQPTELGLRKIAEHEAEIYAWKDMGSG